jgi:sugar fermentation stimulation protein A
VTIGRLGVAEMKYGCYLYTGSALGDGAQSLERRVERHSRRSKRKHWHVDYLTADQRCMIKAVIFLRSRRRLECVINQTLGRKLSAEPIIPGAGSSDCGCKGHLMKVRYPIGERRILRLVQKAYRQFGTPSTTVNLHSLSELAA